MTGTIKGGKRAALTNKSRHGEDFYKNIGKKGGKLGHTGGFYWMKQNGMTDKLIEAGRKGGTVSRRWKKPYYVLDTKISGTKPWYRRII